MKHEHMAGWTAREDEMVMAVHAVHGRQWRKIASALDGRSAASVRNRFLRIERGKKMQEKGETKNRCTLCGEPKAGHTCLARGGGGRVAGHIAAHIAGAHPRRIVTAVPVVAAVPVQPVAREEDGAKSRGCWHAQRIWWLCMRTYSKTLGSESLGIQKRY